MASTPKKGVLGWVVGWVLVVIGCLGLIFGFFEYSIWSQNQRTLDYNRLFGYVSQHDIDLVNFQYSMMILGFVVGAALLFIGVALVANAARYNKQVDKTIENNQLIQAVRAAVSSGQPSFYCDQCGATLALNARFCPVCGKRL